MKRMAAVFIVACVISGCGASYDGRYPIDSIRLMTDGARVTELTNETYPLDAWFEIESGNCIRIHAAGVTSTYGNAKIVKTEAGFDAVSDGPHGGGKFSWAFNMGRSDGSVCLTFTRDGIHYLKLTSKGRASG